MLCTSPTAKIDIKCLWVYKGSFLFFCINIYFKVRFSILMYILQKVENFVGINFKVYWFQDIFEIKLPLLQANPGLVENLRGHLVIQDYLMMVSYINPSKSAPHPQFHQPWGISTKTQTFQTALTDRNIQVWTKRKYCFLYPCSKNIGPYSYFPTVFSCKLELR